MPGEDHLAARVARDRVHAPGHRRAALGRRSREDYVGPWLPEPIIGEGAPGAAELAELGESLTFAFLLLLERLGPAERAALLLHEVLDLPHAEIARVLGRTSRRACSSSPGRAADSPGRASPCP